MESFTWCARFHGSTPQSSLRLASSPKGEPIYKISLPFRGGGPSQTVEGFFVESFAWCARVSRKYPSVTCGDSSAQGTPYGCPKGEPITNKPPLKGVTPHGVGRCPQGRGDRSVRGGPAKLVEGFLWNLLIGVKGLCNNPSVSLRLPAPFSREPKVKASLEKGGEPPLGGGGIFCEIFYMMF